MYRPLTEDEIIILENNNCWAEDWDRIEIAEEGFQPKFLHRVLFYGDIRLGTFEKEIEVSKGFLSIRASMTLHCAMFALATTA